MVFLCGRLWKKRGARGSSVESTQVAVIVAVKDVSDFRTVYQSRNIQIAEGGFAKSGCGDKSPYPATENNACRTPRR
jgi:hypothetical protein